MKWILFFQTPYDTIKFITNEDSSYQILSYKKFKTFISSFKILDIGNFYDALDKFQTVLFDCTAGTWTIQTQELSNPTFEQLLKLNPSLRELEEEKKRTDPLLKKKSFIDKIFDFKKDNSFIKKDKDKHAKSDRYKPLH